MSCPLTLCSLLDMVEKCLEEDLGSFRGQIQTVVDTLEVRIGIHRKHAIFPPSGCLARHVHATPLVFRLVDGVSESFLCSQGNDRDRL